MSNNLEDNAEHNLTLYVTKGVTGVLVGHVKEIPEIIVQANTEDELEKETSLSVNVYWNNFPLMHDKLFPKHVSATLLAKGNYFKEHLQYRKIELTVPQF